MNADVGEGGGTQPSTTEKELMRYLSSVNVACGFHAGSPRMMWETVAEALANKVCIGAHPGYPDRENFGRVSMPVSGEELCALLAYQVGALKSMVEAQGQKLSHVKPHGALYNDLAVDYSKAALVANTLKNIDGNLIFVGLANSHMIAAAKDAGLKTREEVFADRAYTDSGLLVPRSIPGAVLQKAEHGIANVLEMVEKGELTSIDGKKIKVNAETVCVHGDHENALAFAQLLHDSLTKKGIRICAGT